MYALGNNCNRKFTLKLLVCMIYAAALLVPKIVGNKYHISER